MNNEYNNIDGWIDRFMHEDGWSPDSRRSKRLKYFVNKVVHSKIAERDKKWSDEIKLMTEYMMAIQSIK